MGRPWAAAPGGLSPCGRQILGHPVPDWGNGSQIRKDRFQIVIAQLIVPLPGHGGQDRRAVFPNPRVEHSDEILLGPLPRARLLVRRKVAGEGSAPGPTEGGQMLASRIGVPLVSYTRHEPQVPNESGRF